jgi:hypothetical protein
MPSPKLPNTGAARVASSTKPLGVHAHWDVPNGTIRGISGVPLALKGSMINPAVYSFGALFSGGWDTRGARGQNITRYGRGNEDMKWRKIR